MEKGYNMLRLCCPCHFGLESVLGFEIKKIGGENLNVSDGRISFDGDFSSIARANIRLATAERVLIELGSFKAETFTELFDGVRALNFEDFIGKTDAFPVKGHSLKSKLHSIPDCQSIIKKAAVERLKSVYRISRFEETGPKRQISFNIIKDIVTIYLDTSGEGLHKRGYRKTSNEAPIKETLAAGIVDLARVKSGSIVCDPMCGSGTIIIESAYKALGIAPGLHRGFAAEKWDCVPKSVWETERNAALGDIRENDFRAYGFDIDKFAVELSRKNARTAGIGLRARIEQRDIKNHVPIEGAITICNPPYGERMLELRQAEELYRQMGQVLRPSKTNPCYIISPHEEFEKFFGKKADKKRKLYNGMLKCNLYMYYL